ncbi:hypothetical protein Bca4012_025646 [Brassica carinata]
MLGYKETDMKTNLTQQIYSKKGKRVRERKTGGKASSSDEHRQLADLVVQSFTMVGVDSRTLAVVNWEELHCFTGPSHPVFLLKHSTREIDRVGQKAYPGKPLSP